MNGCPFVGRRRELALLQASLSELPKGRGQLWLVRGEPGVGKSRLVDELVSSAKNARYVFAWGAAWDGGGEPAYWPWIQIVRVLAQRLKSEHNALFRALGPLWSDPAQTAGPVSSDQQLAEFRRFDALRALIAMVAERDPVVLVLDDLHAADQASLRALEFTARALRHSPVMIVGTYREAEVRLSPELHERLFKVERLGQVLQLGPLEQTDIYELVSDLEPVSDGLVARIYDASGGNPLFAVELINWVRTGGEPEQAAQGVQAIVRERAAGLGPDERALLDAAAVGGRIVPLPILATVLGWPLQDVRALATSPRLGAIVAAGGEDLNFLHGVFREAAYGALSSEQRALLHLRWAEQLERAQNTVNAGALSNDEVIARHRLLALPHGDVRVAARAALRAARACLDALACDRAAVLLRQTATSLGDAGASALECARVELELARALAADGQWQESRSLARIVAERARTEADALLMAEAALVYGAQLRFGVVDPELLQLLRESLAALGMREPALRARLLARLAAAEQPAADPRGPLVRAREALQLARRTLDPDTLLATLFSAGSALADYAPVSERLSVGRELVRLSLMRGELSMAQHGYARMLVDSLDAGDLAGARLSASAHAQLGQALGHARWRWQSALIESMFALMEGRFEDSARALLHAEQGALEIGDGTALTCVAVHRWGALRASERASLDQQFSRWDQRLSLVPIGAVLLPLLRGAALVRSGYAEGARTALNDFAPSNLPPVFDPIPYCALAELAVAVGDRVWASRLLPGFEAQEQPALSWGMFGLIWEAPTAYWRGLLLVVNGQRDRARLELEEAFAIAEKMGARPLRARIALDLSELLATSAPQRARELRALAAAEAQQLNLAGLHRRVIASSRATERSHVLADDAAPAADATSALAPVAPAVPAGVFELSRDGEVWTLSAGGRSHHLKHSRGLELLSLLVSSPGREFHVLELAAESPAAQLGDAGPMIDQAAKTAYQRRIREIESELAESEDWSDHIRSERLRAERELLHQELARGFGIGGRERKAGDAVERARVNVQKRLRGAIKRIAEVRADLGAHLETHVKTGTYVVYRGAG